MFPHCVDMKKALASCGSAATYVPSANKDYRHPPPAEASTGPLSCSPPANKPEPLESSSALKNSSVCRSAFRLVQVLPLSVVAQAPPSSPVYQLAGPAKAIAC